MRKRDLPSFEYEIVAGEPLAPELIAWAKMAPKREKWLERQLDKAWNEKKKLSSGLNENKDG